MMPTTPAEAFLEWFDGLHDAVQGSLASEIVCLSPEAFFPRDPDVINPLQHTFETLPERIRELADRPLHDAGVALTMIGLVDFIILKTAKSAYWEEVRDNNQAALTIAQDKDEEDFFQRHIESTRFLEKLWGQAAASWQQLRSTSLSHERIRDWILASHRP